MRIILSILLVLVPITLSTPEDDLNYVRQKVKAYKARHLNAPTASRNHMAEPIQKESNANLTEAKHVKTITEVNMESSIGDALFDGDILLTRQQADEIFGDDTDDRKKRQAMNTKNIRYLFGLWERNISYKFSANYPIEWYKYVRHAASLYNNLTCLRIQENGPQRQHILIVRDKACFTYIGRTSHFEEQPISLSDECQATGPVIHEFGHALGMFHTQSRIDRDDYVTISGATTENNQNYKKTSAYENDNLGVPYDYGSVMHYSKQPEKDASIVAKDPLYTGTLGSPLDSFNDILTINKLYNCIDDCASTRIPCFNGGYPNPNACHTCICPRGFGGDNCSLPGRDAKSLHIETDERFCFNGSSTGVNINGLEDLEFEFKNYWITTNYKKIKITYNYMVGVDKALCNNGCKFGGVEIKAKEDKTITGYRFCCDEERVIISNTSLVPIIVYHRKDYSSKFSFCVERVIGDVPTTATPQPTTTIHPDLVGSCVDNEGIRRKNGEQWTINREMEKAKVTWTCKNGWVKVLYCKGPYPWYAKDKQLTFGVSHFGVSETMNRWMDVTCEEDGFIDKKAPRANRSCIDHYGNPKQHGENWVMPETLVTWICFDGYRRPYSCDPVHTGYPKDAWKYGVDGKVNEITRICDVDGFIELKNSTSIPTTTITPVLQTCKGHDGVERKNGEQWLVEKTNVTWTCKNGYLKGLYCQGPALDNNDKNTPGGMLAYLDHTRSSAKEYFYTLITCEEEGVIGLNAPRKEKSCIDQYGKTREQGEKWEIPETYVTWSCFGGYIRPHSCIYGYPWASMEFGENVSIQQIMMTCDVDGFVEMEEATTMRPLTTMTTSYTTTTSTTTQPTTTSTTPAATTTKTVPCVDDKGIQRSTGEHMVDVLVVEMSSFIFTHVYECENDKLILVDCRIKAAYAPETPEESIKTTVGIEHYKCLKNTGWTNTSK